MILKTNRIKKDTLLFQKRILRQCLIRYSFLNWERKGIWEKK